MGIIDAEENMQTVVEAPTFIAAAEKAGMTDESV